ncbi:MAG: TonB-dependent receptor [Bacteroidaceae bacterium]|nr:TonB-dependent receptor [Bacteroides sp.]MBQ4588520.1 TonB-dependent receptor [Bacteroidaceae bacterium]
MLKRLKTVSMMLFLMGASTGAAFAVASTGADDVKITQQSETATGVVKDALGETVIGASVIVKGTTNGTITDFDGNFSLAGVKKGDIIQISFVGYVTQEVAWNGTPLNVVLNDDTQALEEVVVVAFGTQKKVNVTGAVSSVGAKEISARPVSSTVEALQGVVPGMNISTSSDGGSLKGSKSFNIRGTGTIGSGSSVTPLVLIDGMEGDINAINPQDIENISVLKDAAASSIYGSRAPGGVILITTKKGKEGKAVINYNNNFRFNTPMNMPHMANSYDFALAINDQLAGGGQSPMYSEKKLQQILDYQQGKSTQYMWPTGAGRWNAFDDPNRQDVMPTANTDWLHEMFGTSFTHEHSLSVSGGTEKIQYYLSANYLDQGGLLKYGEDGKQRYSLTGKINAQLADWLKVGYSIRFNRTDYTSPSFASAGSNTSNVFYFDVCRYWPVIPKVDPNGYYTAESKIYQLQDGGRYSTQADVVAHQLQFLIEPIENWKTTIELNYRTNYNFDHTDYQTAYAYDVAGNPYAIANSTTGVTEYAYKSNFFNPNIFSEYSFSLNDAHNFKVMAGFQSELYKDRDITASRNNIMAGLPTLNTTNTNPRVSGGYGEWATAGFFGRLNYDYQGRYLLEANVRYDGTSRFLEDQRWNVFPSFSAGWNIAREAFFEDYTDLINNLKLRGSWGELGNQNTTNWYPFYRELVFKQQNGGWLTSNTAKPDIAYEGELVSSLLGWEKTRTWDIGFDLGMFSNRLNVTFDYFQRQTLDMVGPGQEMPDVMGIDPAKINNLNMTSKGWELQISWRDQIQDFKYGATLALSDSKVTVDKYPNDSKNLSTYYAGYELGELWGYETVGIAKTQAEMDAHLAKVDQSAMGGNWGAGDIMYADIDGDGRISSKSNTLSDHGDKVLLGNKTPRYNFGLNLDAAWKGFDLKVFFQGTLKRDYMPSSSATMFWGAVGYWQTNFFEAHLDYFRPADTTSPLGANVDGYFPRPLESGKNRYAQTRYLQDASYCRLKNVTLGYTLPSELTKKFALSNLRFFVSGENLLTITSLVDTFDPETIGVGDWDGCTYPLSKTISFGLSATF